MPCDPWIDLISAAADGELDDEQSAALDEHLARCASCGALLDRFGDLRRRRLVGREAVAPRLDVEALVRSTAAARAGRTLRRRAAAVGTVAAAAAVVFVLGSGTGTVVPDPPADPQVAAASADRVITTTEDRFSDPQLRVAAGAKVEWRNSSDTEHHLVRRIGGTTLAADLEPGQVELVTFDDPGVYPYSCTLHAGMDGTVVVHS